MRLSRQAIALVLTAQDSAFADIVRIYKFRLLTFTTKNKETKHHIHQKQKRETEKPALTNKTIYTLIWYVFYDLRPGHQYDTTAIAFHWHANQTRESTT